MKTFRLTILFLLSPITFFAQTLTGLWMGSVSNDSTTIRKDQAFEIVLTQYKDKVYGYSRSTFIVNDTLFYIVKRVKGTIEGDMCEVKDDKIVSHNFPGRVDKGVKMISTFRFNNQDSSWHLDGDWKTNKTKKYYSISGRVELKSERNLEQSKIFPHLEELKLADDVAFYKESKKQPEPVVVVAKTSVKETRKEPIKENTPTVASAKDNKKKDEVAKTTTPETKQPVKEVKTETVTKKEDVAVVTPKPVTNTETKQPVKDTKPETIVKKEDIAVTPVKDTPKETTIAAVKETKKEEQKATPQNPPANVSIQYEQKPERRGQPSVAETKKPETIVTSIPVKEKEMVITPAAKPAAAQIKERKIAAPQIVNYKSDSLELALYDNGEVDGDTVSVLLNGEVILARQGLKASAIKKTIYFTSTDSSTLVLYAENLGKYPPNTGLLIVRDGEETYQIRFSADLQQNAAVIFKRKKN